MMDFKCLPLRLSLLLLVTQMFGDIAGDTIFLEIEEGGDIHLQFTVRYTEFSILELKRDNSKVYRNDRRQVTVYRGKSISLNITSHALTFILRDADRNDSGIYKCVLTGLQAPPVYNVKVISSAKFISISKNLERWEPFSLNETIFVIENEEFNLTCRACGGLQEYCNMSWLIENVADTFYNQDILTCDQYQGESLLTIHTVSVDLNNSMILCVSEGLQASIILRIKRKPNIIYEENMLTENSKNELTCLLNDTSEYPIFQWSLDSDDVTENATQKRVKNVLGHLIWKSTLSFYPSRQHFAKLLSCKITDDEERSDTITLKIKFRATITRVFSSPSHFVEVDSYINITCIATGFPKVDILWFKDCVRGDCFNVPQESFLCDLNETTFSSTIVFEKVAKTEVGRYTCRAFNAVEPRVFAEKDINIRLEEFGIIGGNTISIVRNQMVNLSCLVKETHNTSYITWTINDNVDVTSHATRYTGTNERDELLSRSTLVFHPDKRYNGLNLTCKWGNHERYSDTILLNISDTTQHEANSAFLTVIAENITVISIPLLLVLIVVGVIIVFCWWRRGQSQRKMFHPKSPEKIGIHTLGPINGDLPPRNSPVLYDDITSYTTYVPVSECSGEDIRGPNEFIGDDISEKTCFSQSSKTSIISCHYESSLSNKLKAFFEEDFGIETQEKDNRLSRHFATRDNSEIQEEEEKDTSLPTYNTNNIKLENGTGFSLNLKIHSKITQRGSIFFCDATLTKKMTAMNVTVKVLSEFAQPRERVLFKKEINTVKNLDNHPNIVEVLGICCNSQPNCIILEKIPRKNLKKVLLQDSKIGQLAEWTETLRQYIEQICSGMVFLSTNEYFHPDLICDKVTVDEQRICKLYDFVPVQIFLAQEDDNQKDILRNGLVAPEILQGKHRTYGTEVWGFGILLCEIYYYGLNYTDDERKTNIQGQLVGLDLLEKPDSFPEEMYNLMLMCRCEDPPSRPSFSSVLDDIKGMRYKTTISTTE